MPLLSFSREIIFALKFGVVKSYALECVNGVVKLTSAYNFVEND